MKITFPTMPKNLTSALTSAEQLLNERSRLNELLTQQTQDAPRLLRGKLDAEAVLSRARTAELLGETTDETIAQAEDELSACERDYKAANGIRASLRERLADQQPSLATAQSAITASLTDYRRAVVDAFEKEYETASEAFARVQARGNLLAKALKITIDMPPPHPGAAGAADLGELADATRIGQVVDGLSAALTSITSDRQASRRESQRVAAFQRGCVWELLRPLDQFAAGTWVEAPLLSESMLERLFLTRAIRRVSDAELAVDAHTVPIDDVPRSLDSVPGSVLDWPSVPVSEQEI